ncbi:MAG: hypothetical protein JO115_15025 [Pseudonocardiales bacterium]|nr:hypothetical protein [Pseudonocardiales bacterium]
MLTLLTVGGAVLGALIALLRVMFDSFGAALIVTVGVLVGTTLATRVLTSPGPSIPGTQSNPGYPPDSGPPDLRPDGNEDKPSPPSRNSVQPLPVAPPPTERGTVVLPVRPDVGWWSETSVAGARRDQPKALSAPPLDLSGYVESGRVVQCPNCASFRINVRHVDVGYAFSCHRCGHTWDWQSNISNMPWPKTVKVSKRLRADSLSRGQTDRQEPNTSRRY